MARWRLLVICLAAAGLGATGVLHLFGRAGVAAAGAESVVFCREPGLPIPDGNGTEISDSLRIESELTVLSAEIAVTVTGGWVGDLVVTVARDGEGPAVTLLERLGVAAGSPYGCGAGLLAATFADAAPDAPPACRAEITGTLRPAQPLALLAGQPLSGAWQLRVADQAPGQAATLQSWCLRAEGVAAPRLAVAPASASSWVAPGHTATTAVTLTNEGSAPWQWGATPAAAANSLLLAEGFEGADLPPAGWTLQPELVTRTWMLVPAIRHQGEQAATVLGSSAPQDEWLLSPPLWLARGWLTFWSLNRESACRLSDACDLEAWLLPEGGEATLLGRADDDWQAEGAWTAHSWELTPHLPASGPVRVALRYHGTGDSTAVFVDDVQVSGQLAPDGCREAPPPWLAVMPPATELAPGATAPLALALEATGLVTGTYSGALCLAGNEPLTPLRAIPVTLYVDSCASLAGAAPRLAIAPGAGGEAVLSWEPPPVPASYRLARGTQPYLEAPWLALPQGSTGAVDAAPGAAAFYQLEATTCGGAVTAASNRAGWLVYEAAPAGESSAGWTGLSLALDAGAGLDQASELVGAIAGASRLLRWETAQQGFAAYTAGAPGTDFGLQTGDPFFVETGSTASGAFPLTGDVPAPGAVSFTLAGGTPCRWNHLSLPLELGSLTNAQALAEAIRGADSLAVEQLLSWDAAAQAFAYWVPAPAGGAAGLGDNFPVRIGGEYFVCLRADREWP